MEETSKKRFLLFIIVAFLFGVLARMYWVYWANGIEQFKLNGEFLIHTYDGYAFAEGARDLIQGFHQSNDNSMTWMALPQFTYVLAKILPFSFESIIFYMSAFFSSLLVIPMMLIARDLKMEKAGFFASLLALVANSYYARTMVGRYDTDMLIIVLAVFVLWSLVHVAIRKSTKGLVFIFIFTLSLKWWYPQSYSLLISFGFMFLLFTVVCERKNPLFYLASALLFISASNLSFYPKVVVVLIFLILVFRFYKKIDLKISLLFLIFSFISLFFTGGFDEILYQLKGYVFKSKAVNEDIGLHFYNVIDTIIETKKIGYEKLALRVSGSVIVFILSTFGLLKLFWDKRVMAISFPLVGLGCLAIFAGLRFTIYAVPIFAFGFAYFCVTFVNFLFRKKESLGFFGNGFLVVLILLALYPMILNIYIYKAPTSLKKDEATILYELKKETKREDYVISWWDYGYPIRYFSDVKTLIDGGKHTGEDNFPVSFILTHNPISAYNMAKLAVKYTENSYITQNKSILSQMLRDFNQTDINTFLSSLKDADFKFPKLKNDIYLYLPKKMAGVFATIDKFSNINLKNGKNLSKPVFIIGAAKAYRKDGYIDIGRNILIQRNGENVIFGRIKYDVNTVALVKNGKAELVQKNQYGNFCLIFSLDYKQFIVLDKRLFNSTFVQMGLLGLYDNTKYEKIIDKDSVKVYKLK